MHRTEVGREAQIDREALLEAKDETIRTLREQLESERRANEENRRIIAALIQRVPELEAPASPEPPGGPTEAAGEPERAESPARPPQALKMALRSRGGAGCSVASEKYPLQAAQRRMLGAVNDKVEEARRADHWRYRAIISIYEVGALGEEIGLDELDAVEMFRRLWREDYFEAAGVDRGFTDERGNPLPFLHANVEGLTEKGLREIGKLPDPGEKLIHAFEVAMESIERSDIPEPKKRELLERARLVIDALRTAEGLADLAGRMFGV